MYRIYKSCKNARIFITNLQILLRLQKLFNKNILLKLTDLNFIIIRHTVEHGHHIVVRQGDFLCQLPFKGTKFVEKKHKYWYIYITYQ